MGNLCPFVKKIYQKIKLEDTLRAISHKEVPERMLKSAGDYDSM